MTKHIFVFILLTAVLHSQQSGSAYYRSAVMNGNNIHTVFGNWGVIGQPVDTRPRGTWPKVTNGYLGDNSLLIGVELPIKDYNGDGKPDTIHSVVTSPISRPATSFDTNDKSGGGIPWTFMPVEGFFNPAKTSVAMSNDYSTWPNSWAGSWKGLNGTNTIVADLESYFQMDDQNDVRFSSAVNNPNGIAYRPDTLNLPRKGAGLRVDVRYLQYTHPLFNDILFRVYDVTNESMYDYNKVFVGHLTGTLIGVTGTQNFNEYDDDYSILYKKENVVVAGDYDNNNYRNPFWRGSVGKIGEAFLQTSAGESIASYVYFTPSNSISLGDDELLWKQFSPGYHGVPKSIVNDTTVMYGQDGDYTFGSQYFSLPSKGKKRIVSAIAYDYSSSGIFQKIKLGKVLVQKNFNLSNMLSQLSLPAFSIARTLSSVVPIQWPIHDPTGTTEIYFSPDAGATWITIGEGLQDKGEFLWNTVATSDCAYGKIRIFFKDSAGKYVDVMESGQNIAVNNAGNGSPFVKILSGPSDTSTITATILPLQVLAGDPDNKNLTATIYYSVGGNFIKHQELSVVSDTVPQIIMANIEEMPNSTNFRIKVELKDGTFLWSDSTEPFAKSTHRNMAAPSNITVLSGTTQAKISVNVVDKSKTTANSYVLSFSDTAAHKPKTISVFNKTTNTMLLDRVELTRGTETPIFDGIRLSIVDPGTRIDSAYWNKKDSIYPTLALMPSEIVNPPNETSYGYAKPSDYQIIFGMKGASIDLEPYVGFSTTPESTNVAVVNKKTGKRVEFYYYHPAADIHDFYFVEDVAGKKRLTWTASLIQKGTLSINPVAGDTLTVITKKGISIYDSLQIKNVSLSVEKAVPIPREYSLSQNYPNPFNPVTTIQYGVPTSGPVKITIYDILGRDMTTIRHHHVQPGTYSVTVDASNFSSGVYLYQLTATGFTKVKKMMVIK